MKIHSNDFAKMKDIKPIPMLTAYTCPVARSIEEAGVASLGVGPSQPRDFV